MTPWEEGKEGEGSFTYVSRVGPECSSEGLEDSPTLRRTRRAEEEVKGVQAAPRRERENPVATEHFFHHCFWTYTYT